MTDHCCHSHEHQVAFVANISLDELAQKRKQTLSKLNNSSSQLCSLWFFRTSLKRLHEKTPKNRNKNACRLSSLSSLAGSSTPNSWNSPLLQLEDTPLRASSRHVNDLAYDGPPTNECLNFSPANPTYGFASKITQSQQPTTSVSSELPGLGISLDDSRISWTSSLATPPGYTAEDALPDEDETEFPEEMTKTKTLARALFSPDEEQSTLDGVGHLSSNISVAFKNCDKTPTTNRMVSSPNTLISPVLFESKDTSTVLPEHESGIHHDNPFSISPSRSLQHGNPHATIGDNKLPEEISCRSLDTPLGRTRTDIQLHSILSKKKHFSSTPKHVHFSDSFLLVSDCDKRPNRFNSGDKLRLLRDSTARPSDLTLVSQPDKGTSFVETPLSVISKKQHDENPEGGSTSSATLGRMDAVPHELHVNPDSKTTHGYCPYSKDESSIHASFTQSSDMNSTFVDSSEHLSSVAPGKSSNSRSRNSSLHESTAPNANENNNANLKSLSSERLSSVGSSSNTQSYQNNLDPTVSPELISSADISENSQSLSKTNEFPEVSLQQADPEDLTVSSSGNKDDKNTIVFTQLSSSYDEKLISEVDRMSNRDLQEMSANSKPPQIERCPPIGDNMSNRDLQEMSTRKPPQIEQCLPIGDNMSNRDLQEMSTRKPPQIEQCLPIGDNISGRKEVDLDNPLSIIDNDAKLTTQNQNPGPCTAVTPINRSSVEKPVQSKETVSLSKTNPNNLDTPTSSTLSTPKFAISLGGKLRRKSKGFLYPTASQINNTSPLVAFNFKVQSINDNNPNKGTVDPSVSANPDTTSSTGKSKQETDLKKSPEQDLGSDAGTLVCKNTESSSKFSDLHSTTIKQHEMAMMDPLPNNRKPQSSSQPKMENGSPISSTLELPDKTAEGAEAASSNYQDRHETEKMSSCKDSIHEPAQTNKTFQGSPVPDTVSNPNNESSINVCQVSKCKDIGLYRKAKFYRSPHKPKILETEVPKENYCESSIRPSSKSEPNTKSLGPHSTSVVDPKSLELSQKTETKQSFIRLSDEVKSLIPDSNRNQNAKEAGSILKKSTAVKNDQEMLEMNMLTPSQMVRWDELDNFSEAFIEGDDNSSSNILHGQNDQVCITVSKAQQVDTKVKPKKNSSDLTEREKTTEEEILMHQNTNITSETKETMQSVSHESYKLSHENEESIKVQGGFSTAGGKQITVKEESWQKAQSILNEESTEAQFLEDFSTAKGKLITVREENLKKAQNLVNDESSEAQSLGGFSTAGGKQIIVTEESLKKAQNLVNDESVQSLGGFSTAGGEQIIVTEESLKKAQNLVNDESVQSLGGFSTAGGKQIIVTEESLKKAQNLVNDESSETQSSTAKGKLITVSSLLAEFNDDKIPCNKESEINEVKHLSGNVEDKNDQPEGLIIDRKIEPQMKKMNEKFPDQTNFLHPNDTIKISSPSISEERSIQPENKPSTNLRLNENLTVQNKPRTPNLKDYKHLPKGFRPFKAPRMLAKNPTDPKSSPLHKYTENEKTESMDENHIVKCLDADFQKENEKLQEVYNLKDSSTAREKQINVIEENLEKAQNILHKESIEDQTLGGFSTAGGKEINVKEESLKKAQNLLNEESGAAYSVEGFTTAKGKQISVEGESLKKAQRFVNDESMEVRPQGGFSTARGKQTIVQEESLKKAQKLVNNESVEANSLGGFSTARGKQITVQEESLKKAQKLVNDESVEAHSLGSFSTARGKQITVQEESLKKAQKLVNDESMEAHSLGGFSTATGKQIIVQEESLKKAQKLVNDESMEAHSLGGFSTARGKQITVQEESLKKAQKLVNDESVEANSLGGFSTARGKQITVQEENLKKAQKLVNDESMEAHSLGGFSTARGKQITVQEESLKKAQKLVNDESVEANSLGSFSTARGKQITVQEESLKKAQKLVNDESVEAHSLGGFSTARGKQITVQEESLKKAQKLVNDESMEAHSLGGFSTATGKQIIVQEESLKKAQKLVNDESMEAHSLGGFSTARGKQIIVQEESLKKAQKLVNDESMEAHSLGGFSTATGKQITVQEESLKKAQKLVNDESMEAHSLVGFSTARGKQITVQEESLKKAQKLVNDESVEANSLGSFSTARGKQITVQEESLKKAQKLVNDESVEAHSLGGFSTARGKQITVQEESLKKAQKLVNDESMEAHSLGGFSTARGKQISVKEESLKKAQNLFSDESTETQSVVGSLTDKGNQISIDGSIEPHFLGGFSTAKGQQISVTEESLKKAENVLVENVDAMDENVVNDLLSTDFTASQMNGGAPSSSKVFIDGNIISPVCTLAEVSEVTNNDNHMIEDIFNCSWEDDSSTPSKKMQAPSVHPPNKLKRSVSEVISDESGSTVKKMRIDVAENDSSPSVCRESSKNNLDGDKPCLLPLPAANAEQLGRFSKSQYISDDALMQSVKIYENLPDADSHFQIVSEDPKTESEVYDAKDQYLNDSDCSNESEMALAVEMLEGERKCSEISRRSTKQPLLAANQMTDHKISGSLGDEANCPSNHSLHKFTLGNEKICEDSTLEFHFSEESQQEAVKAINKQTPCEEGQNIDHQILDAENPDEMDTAFPKTDYPQKMTPKDTNSKAFIAFQTAHGRDVPVSEKSVNKARQILGAENPDEMDTACSKTEYSQKMSPKDTNSKTFIAFQTAHGRDVPVTEKSVNKVRQILGAENPEEIDSTCSKAKYPRKVIPSFGPAVQHNPEDGLHADPQINSDATSIPSTFKSLQHETNKISILSQKQSSISWKPCMSTPEADRSGISPIFTDPKQILSDQGSGSQQHLFSDLVSRNPLDIEQRVKEKTFEKTGQDDSSKKTDFKTPYRKTPAAAYKAQETVKVLPRISRPVFKGYGTLPIFPQKECQKYQNSNSMSSTTCQNSNNMRGHIDKIENEKPRKENQNSQNLSRSNDSFSSHTAVSNLDNTPHKSHYRKSCNKNQNTNQLFINSSAVKSSSFPRKSSESKQFDKKEIIKQNVPFPQETKSESMPDKKDAEGSSSKPPIQEIKKNSEEKISSLAKNKLGLVLDEPDGLSKKDPIPEIKENLPDQYQKTNQEEMQTVSQNVPLLLSSEDNLCDGKKSSKNLESSDKNPVRDDQLESKPTETYHSEESKPAEMFCSEESHLEEGRLEQDMIVLRKKRKKIQPLTGILSRRKASRKRIKLSDLLESINVSSFLPEQFFNYGIHRSTLAITSANAINYRFQLSAFYNAKCLHRIIIGDGAILVADRKSTAGKEEFLRAFQTIEGVDPKLISPEWLFNHYRWIIWKLASYEVSLPQYFGGRCLSPEMVALQLKFRYDFEIDKCQRSALRRIIERDDTPAKRMVLCVSQINQEARTSDAAQATAHPLATLEVTDGWYSTKLFLDSHLSFLVSKGKLKIGQKLCLSNAELVGGDTACSPLECPESIGLKVSGNGCRPARWDSRLGYQTDPRPLCLPLVQIAGDGGLVGCVDVIVTRIYPIRYMEKVPGGASVFRTSRAEKRREQRHEVLQQEAAEKLFNRLQASIESNLPKQGPKQNKNWSREEIQYLDNGQDIYEAMMCAMQPDKLLNCLSESQLVMLEDYKRVAEELKAQKMKEEFQKAISNEENPGLKRNVTTIMKVRLIGCSHIDQLHSASTVLTIWRPSEDLQQTLEEGQRYQIYNLMPSPARFSFLSGLDVHLTVTRSTRYEPVKRHPSIPQDLSQPRKISSAAELQAKSTQVDRLEVDMTGIVLRIVKTVSANQRKYELLYVVDIEENIFALRFWGGLQIFFVDDLLLEEVVFAGLNLLLRHASPQRGTSIPVLDVCSEVTHFSVNPQQDYLRVSMDQLHKLKASGEFLVKSKEKLDSLLTSEKSSLITPRTPSTSGLSTGSPILRESDEAREMQRMIQQDKCTKLMAYGSCPSLSPLSVRLPSTVRKAFKPPSITKSKNK